MLRPHMRTICLSCRAALREFLRGAVASVVPAAAFAGSHHGGGPVRASSNRCLERRSTRRPRSETGSALARHRSEGCSDRRVRRSPRGRRNRDRRVREPRPRRPGGPGRSGTAVRPAGRRTPGPIAARADTTGDDLGRSPASPPEPTPARAGTRARAAPPPPSPGNEFDPTGAATAGRGAVAATAPAGAHRGFSGGGRVIPGRRRVRALGRLAPAAHHANAASQTGRGDDHDQRGAGANRRGSQSKPESTEPAGSDTVGVTAGAYRRARRTVLLSIAAVAAGASARTKMRPAPRHASQFSWETSLRLTSAANSGFRREV